MDARHFRVDVVWSVGRVGGWVSVVEDLPESGPVVVGFGRIRLEELNVEFCGKQNG